MDLPKLHEDLHADAWKRLRALQIDWKVGPDGRVLLIGEDGTSLAGGRSIAQAVHRLKLTA